MYGGKWQNEEEINQMFTEVISVGISKPGPHMPKQGRHMCVCHKCSPHNREGH